LYEDMSSEFETGQGSYDHSTVIHGSQGESYHLFIRGSDYSGNTMNESIEVKFTIDTLQRPVAWNEKYYDTTDWQIGSAPFHFDDGSQTGTTVPYARTVYLRKSFNVPDLSALYQMVAFIQYDNGFVLYINGNEVRRVNMPDGEVDYETWAGNLTQSSITITLDASVLESMNDGQNVIAAEVHQSLNDSSDFKFDLQLIDPSVLISYGSEWAAFAAGAAPEIKPLGSTDIDENTAFIPEKTDLAQNYPNPFNPLTAIRYQLSTVSNVDLSLFNTLGQKVATLVSKRQAAGNYRIEWDGNGYASGIYYCRLVTPQGSMVRKMILMK